MLESIWLRNAHAHIGGLRVMPNMNSEPGKARWLAKGSLEEMPHKSDSNYHEGKTLWAHLGVHPHISFLPPNMYFSCFSTFCLNMEIYFHTANRSEPCQWLPVRLGIVARTEWSHCCGLTCLSLGTAILLQAVTSY